LLAKAPEGLRKRKGQASLLLLADRHNHSWLKRLNKEAVDLGHGNRMLVNGARRSQWHSLTLSKAGRAFAAHYLARLARGAASAWFSATCMFITDTCFESVVAGAVVPLAFCGSKSLR